MIKYYVVSLEERDIRHGIIIYKDVVTSSCRKVIESMTMSFTFETFSFAEMQFTLTDHILYIPHTKVKKDDVPESTKGFPVLLKTDPVCRYFRFERGDVIQVHRKNGTCMYRIVH
jgi:DNA-directed RNA polymerase subunit H (RpoH/RPB5)